MNLFELLLHEQSSREFSAEIVSRVHFMGNSAEFSGTSREPSGRLFFLEVGILWRQEVEVVAERYS